MNEILGALPKVFEFIKRFAKVDLIHGELDNVVNEVAVRAEDLDLQAKHEERTPGKKRKRVLDAYIRRTERYRESAQLVLNGCQEEQWKLKRMKWVPCMERYQEEGQDLLKQGSKLIEEGLTDDEVTRRGERLPLEEDQYLSATVQGHLESAVRAMTEGSAPCIGIYGQAGAGKTNLMKHLYNIAFEDRENFKAVFWATAPEPIDHAAGNYHKALQTCVADGMRMDLDDGVVHDEVRGACKMIARLEQIGPGRVVIFLDNVKREFPSYEVLGMPSLVTPASTSSAIATANESDAASTVNCILVFTTRFKDVCNRMQCDLTLKMDLLEEKEAQELFLHELRCGGGDDMVNGRALSNRQKEELQEIAIQVAYQCARMPLAIIIIARSMAKKDDLREWRTRLNELIGYIATIHNDEAKILEQLKFGYNSLTGENKLCFLEAARMLGDDCEVSKVDIIERWKMNRLIGMDRRGELVDDQGHAILNQLERMCLLQVVPDYQTVTMNKWIVKMAASVS